MLAPCLPHPAHGASVRVEQHVDSESMRPLIDKFAERIGSVDSPVPQSLEPSTFSPWRRKALVRQRSLQERAGVSIDELWVDDLCEAISVGRHVPFALDVLASQRLAFLVEERGVILNPYVIEAARASLEPNFDDRTFS